MFAFSLLHAFCVHGFQAAENPWLWLCLGLACVYTSSSELSATAAICSPASLPFPSCPHSAAFPHDPGCDYIAERSSGTLLRTPSVRLYVVRVPFSKACQQGSWSHSSFCLHPPQRCLFSISLFSPNLVIYTLITKIPQLMPLLVSCVLSFPDSSDRWISLMCARSFPLCIFVFDMFDLKL